MSKTSISDYTIAFVTAALIVSVVILGYGNLDPLVYDVSDFDDETGFSSFSNLSFVAEQTNTTASGVYGTTADSGLFDVIGGLIVKSLEAIKLFFTSLGFLSDNVALMLSKVVVGGGLFVTFIITVIAIRLAGVFIFRIINKTEDEK